MLCKLAWGNVRRAGRDYLVYLLTLTLAVTVFYAFNTISLQTELAGIDPGVGRMLSSTLSGLTVFLACVMGFLMVYANNFIMRRRKKELGLYQILGTGRGRVALVMALETAFVSVAALVLGIAIGVALSQLMVFFTASLFKTTVSNFRFIFSLGAFLLTAGCMVAVFLVTLVFNLRAVAKSKVIELVRAGRQNEQIKMRNPWLSAIVFVIGAILVGIAYHRLLRDGMPLSNDNGEFAAFGMTTGIVIVGTVLLFFGLSGFLLKVLQSARGLYWRGLNMFTLRQLSAKVNTVSFSMAIIAMILFLAITSVTTGMSIASAMTSQVENSTPADYSRVFNYFSPLGVSVMNNDPDDEDAGKYAAASEPVDMMKTSKQDIILAAGKETGDTEGGKPFDLASVAGKTLQLNMYDARPKEGEPAPGSKNGQPAAYVTLAQLAKKAGVELSQGIVSSSGDTDSTSLQVMSASGYNRYRAFRGLDPIDLGEDGYVLATDMGDTVSSIYNAALQQGIEIDIAGFKLRPVVDEVDVAASAWSNGQGTNAGTIIVPDRVIECADLPLYMSSLLVDYRDGLSVEDGDAYVEQPRQYGLVGSSVASVDGHLVGFWGMEATRSTMIESMDNVNALISYLAVYIGFVLVVAAAAILTIQQLSSVADGGRSYRLLSELGTPTGSIQHSILAQQAVFFCFPLVVGIAHSVVALYVVIDLVRLFGNMNIGSMVWLTCAIFGVCYGGYFLLTYVMSKGMVRDSVRLRHAA